MSISRHESKKKDSERSQRPREKPTCSARAELQSASYHTCLPPFVPRTAAPTQQGFTSQEAPGHPVSSLGSSHQHLHRKLSSCGCTYPEARLL